MARRAHDRRIQSALLGYVRASWYNVADTKAIATQVTRAQKKSTSGDVPGARDRWTTSPTSQTTNAIMTRRTDRFAGPRGFTPKTYAPRNALTKSAIIGRRAPRFRTNATNAPAVIRTRSRRSRARRGAGSSRGHVRPRAS